MIGVKNLDNLIKLCFIITELSLLPEPSFSPLWLLFAFALEASLAATLDVSRRTLRFDKEEERY